MAKPITCRRCARENDPGFAFCLDCGQPLRPPASPGVAVCATCGAALQPGFRFCGVCGRAVAAPPPAPPQPGPAPPAARPASPPRSRGAAPRFRLTAMRSDGSPGTSYALEGAEVVCGRSDGALVRLLDPTVSPRHARFTLSGGVLRVEDLGSLNGTFVRLRAARRLAVGDELRVGRQLLRLEPLPRPDDPGARAAVAWGSADPGYRLRLSQLLEGGGVGDVFPLKEGENAVGREAGDVTFPSDRYVSARHARLELRGGEVTVVDEGSSNGTFVKISGRTELVRGDQLLVGGQLLRVDEA